MALYKQTLISQDKGYGMFATTFIPPGALIISEIPLFQYPSTVLTAPTSVLSTLNGIILQAVHKLPKAKQLAFLNLHNAHTTPDPNTGATNPPFLGICRTNGFGLGVDTNQTGIFEHCSRFNHSCIPNAWHIWNPKNGEMEVRALVDIPEGTEITMSYLSTRESKISHPRRRAVLQERYRFLCQCPGCTEPGNISNDEARAKLSRLDEEVGNGILIAMNPARALRHCKNILELLPIIGHQDQIPRTYYDAFQVAIAHGDQARASAFMRLSIKYRRFFQGEDSEEVTPEKDMLVDKPQEHRLFQTVSRKWVSRVRMRKAEGDDGFEEWLWARAEK